MSSIVVFLPGGRRESLRTTPSMTLAQLRDAACERGKIPAASCPSYTLAKSNEKKALDLSLPIRLSGLASGQSLELRRCALADGAVSPAPVNVALTLLSGERVTGTLPSSTTLLDLLAQLLGSSARVTEIERGQKGTYACPAIVFMNREVSGRAALATTTLAGIGATSGSASLRVVAKPTQSPFADGSREALNEMSKALLAASAADTRAAAPAATKETAAPVSAAAAPPLKGTLVPAPAAVPSVAPNDDIVSETATPAKAVVTPDPAAVEPQEAAPVPAEIINRQTEPESTPAASRTLELDNEKEEALLEARRWEEERAAHKRALEEEAAIKAEVAREIDGVVEEEREQQQRRTREEEEAKLEVEEEQWRKAKQARVQVGDAARQPRNVESGDVPESERCFAVFAPSEKPIDTNQIDLPDEFYDLSAEDLQQLAQGMKRAKMEETETLLTQEMRDKMRMKKWEKFKKCMIRVRFPDRVEIQRAFYPWQKVSALTEFVRGCLTAPNTAFTLFITPPVQVLEEKDTFFKQYLVPAAIVHFKWRDPAVTTYPFLRPDLVSRVQELLPPNWSLQTPYVSAPKKPAKIMCSACWASPGEKNCSVCDAHFCRECFNEVHSKSEEMLSHIKQSEAKEAKKAEAKESKSKKDVPKWFAKGARF